MTGHITRRPYTLSTYLNQILPSIVFSHRSRTTTIPVDSSTMAPKVLALSQDETIQAVRDFVNNAVPSVNIDTDSPALPLSSPQSRLAIPREGSSTDPGPSTRRPQGVLSLGTFSDLVRHFKDSILPTFHYATRLLTLNNPTTDSAKPSRLRSHSSNTRSRRSLGKSPSVQLNDQSYEWRQRDATDDYCLFDLTSPGKGSTESQNQTPIVLLLLSPWKYSARDLEDLFVDGRKKKSSSRSSSRRSKIAPFLTKLAAHAQQNRSRHFIISTYEYWSFGRFETQHGATAYDTLSLTPVMPHDSGDSGTINNRAGPSHENDQRSVTVLQASLHWIHQALGASNSVPLSPRKTRAAPSPRKRVRGEEEGDTEEEAEVDDNLMASAWSLSSVDQPSPSKRSKRSRPSFPDLPSIQEEEATSSLRRSTRQRSAVQMSMASSSGATAVAEKTKSKAAEAKRKQKMDAEPAGAESSKRGSRATTKDKPTMTETTNASRPSARNPESRHGMTKVSAPSPRRSRKHAREDDLTDIEDQPSPSKKARIRPPPLAPASLKSPKRPRNEPTAVASPIYVSSSPAKPSRTSTRVTRSSSLVKSSSRTLYLERIYVPGTGLAIAESDRWSNEGNLSDRNRDWLNSKDDSYQTAVESDDREFYGDVPSPAAMAKLRSASEEYDSGYGRSTSPYVPDDDTLKRLAVRTDHLNDPKSMGSLLKKGSKSKKTVV